MDADLSLRSEIIVYLVWSVFSQSFPSHDIYFTPARGPGTTRERRACAVCGEEHCVTRLKTVAREANAGGPGSTPRKIGWGCAARVPKPLFMTKICDISYPI